VLDRAATILCSFDAVTYPVLGWIITPLPQGMVQLLSPSHWNCNHTIFSVLHSILFVVSYLFPPLEMRSTHGLYARNVVSIGNKGHKSSSVFACLAGTITLEVVSDTTDIFG